MTMPERQSCMVETPAGGHGPEGKNIVNLISAYFCYYIWVISSAVYISMWATHIWLFDVNTVHVSVKPTCLYGSRCTGATKTLLVLRCDCEAVVLSADKVREVRCGGISGEPNRSVPSLSWDHIHLCPVTGIPAQRNNFAIAVHRGFQILGHTWIWKKQREWIVFRSLQTH